MDVTVYGVLRGITGDADVTLEFDGGTVDEALDALVAAYPPMSRHLFRDDGRLEPSVRVALDGDRVALTDPCPPSAHLKLHPALQGG